MYQVWSCDEPIRGTDITESLFCTWWGLRFVHETPGVNARVNLHLFGPDLSGYTRVFVLYMVGSSLHTWVFVLYPGFVHGGLGSLFCTWRSLRVILGSLFYTWWGLPFYTWVFVLYTVGGGGFVLYRAGQGLPLSYLGLRCVHGGVFV